MPSSALPTTIIGSGTRAATYGVLLNRHPKFQLIGLHTANSERGQRLSQSLACQWREDPTTALDAAELVVIATCPNQQPNWIRRAAANGQAILAEKPVALTEVDIQSLATMAQDNIFVSHPHRFHQGSTRLKELISSVGRIDQVSLESRRYRSRQRYSHADRDNPLIFGPGVLWDMGIHLLDLFKWCLPGTVLNATMEHSTRDMDLRCTNHSQGQATYQLNDNSEAKLSLHCSDVDRVATTMKIHVQGERGSLLWHNGRLTNLSRQSWLSALVERLCPPRLQAPDHVLLDELAHQLKSPSTTGRLATLNETLAVCRDLLTLQPTSSVANSR